VWDLFPRKVVVGVETAGCLPALRAAALEATRRRCGVHLLHVIEPVRASHARIEELEQVAAELRHAGLAVVEDAAHALEPLVPDDLVVSTELCHGAVVPSLVEASAHACLLVLHQRGKQHRLLSTIQAVVAQEQCPVLVVPPDPPQEDPAHAPCVVAGVDDARRSGRLVEAALAEAARRQARLRLVHGLTARDERIEDLDAAAQRAWLRLRHRMLEDELGDLCRGRPDVDVDVEIVPRAPAAALVAPAQGADVIVVGRGHGERAFARRPGRVTTEVLRHATCPVLVVDGERRDLGSRDREPAQVAVP
jgi:nucleotide-binding universal stress UspA family protein